jgi:hypothetical protein
MLSFIELAKSVNSESKALELLGNNTRAPSLQRNKLYLMKDWLTTHLKYTVVQFLGCGTEDTNFQPVFVEDNYKLNAMKEKQYYFFKAVSNSSSDEVFSFGAFHANNCLCAGSSSARVTFYEINGCEYDAKAPAKSPSSNANKPTQRVKRVIATVDEEEEVSVVVDDDSDPEYMLKFSEECNRLSMMPLDKKARQTFC